MGAKHIHFLLVKMRTVQIGICMHMQNFKKGAIPYVIHLLGMHTPYCALGYVQTEDKTVQQMEVLAYSFDILYR